MHIGTVLKASGYHIPFTGRGKKMKKKEFRNNIQSITIAHNILSLIKYITDFCTRTSFTHKLYHI